VSWSRGKKRPRRRGSDFYVDTRDGRQVEDLLAQREGLDHIKVQLYGGTLVLYSGDGDDRARHARFAMVDLGLWRLDLRHHTGRWEKTPFVGSLSEVFTMLVDTLGFYLEPQP